MVIAVLAGVLTLPSGLGRTQESTSQIRPIGGLTFVDEFELTVVNVVANVTDGSGNPVTDLTRDDFRIFQDGEEKPITNFTLYTQEAYRNYQPVEQLPEVSSRMGDDVVEAGDEPEIQPIYIVLYIDNQNLHPIDRNRALTAVREFVTSTVRPPVEIMVVSYQKSLKILQPFTSDPRQVLDVLREVRTYTGNRTVLDAQRVEILDMMQRYQEEAGSTGRQATSTREYSDIVSRVLAFADQESNDLMFSVEALRSIVNAISGLPGRKSIVYLSNGLPMVAGLGLFSAVSSTYQDHAILNQIGRYDRTSLFESLVDAANAQDVTFHTLGAAGLEDEGLSTAEYRSAQDPIAAWRGAAVYLDSIRYMADGTGGLSVVNTNDISAGLNRIERNLFTYYSLGYTLGMSGADKVHRIRVELPNHPDYKVRFRERFVEKSMATKVQDKVLTGLMFDLDSNPMDVTSETGTAAPAAEGRWTVPVHISFELRTVALLPEGDDYVGRVTLFLAARDDLGKRSDLVRQEHEVRVPAVDYEQAQHERFGITAGLLMESGSYRVSVGLMDQITRQSSYDTFAVSVGDG